MPSDITIIIPTHKRHKYLERSIEYFSSISYAVHYIDSTEHKYSDFPDSIFSNNMSYQHVPNLRFVEKIILALENVDSEYIALCADDDFIFEDALRFSTHILDNDARISAIIGRHLGFNKPYDGGLFQITKNSLSKEFKGDFSSDIAFFLSNYRQVLWGVYRKSVILKAFRIIKKSNFKNDNFIELVIATICCSDGLKVTERYFGAREVTNEESWGRRHAVLKNVKGSVDFDADKRRFIETLKSAVGADNAELAISCYLNSKGKSSFYKKMYFSIYKKISVFLVSSKKKMLLESIIKKHQTNIEV